MNAEETRRRFLDFRRRLYGEHDLTAVDAYIHPEFMSHNALVKGQGREAYKTFARTLHAGVPDLRALTQHVIVEDEFLMAMTDWTGTHNGPFLGVPATGRTLHFSTADRFRLRDGWLFEHWDVVDRLDASIAMGLVQNPQGA